MLLMQIRNNICLTQMSVETAGAGVNPAALETQKLALVHHLIEKQSLCTIAGVEVIILLLETHMNDLDQHLIET